MVDTGGSAFAAGRRRARVRAHERVQPFVLSLICGLLGPDGARERIGVNGTGLPFSSLSAVERSDDGRTSPMVNAGAIAATSLARGGSTDDKW
ncbi:MAG: glutaminase [Solirubrobacteraceae bacterium]